MADQVTWWAVEDGLVNFENFLDEFSRLSEDMTWPLTLSVQDVQSAILGQFETEGGRSGSPWFPLTEEYALWKSARAPFPMLMLPVELLSKNPGTQRGEMIIDTVLSDDAWTIGETDALFAPDSTRAAWHQEGAVRSRGGFLPARDWLDLIESDYDQIYDNFDNWLESALLEA